MKACHIEPSALKNGMVPLDIDVTPMDNSKSHKEGVSRTYKNFYGYAPIMAYIGAEGYACNFDLREGSQHCQKDTPKLLKETIAAANEMTDKPLLVRMDSKTAKNWRKILENAVRISAVPVREKPCTSAAHGAHFTPKKREILP